MLYNKVHVSRTKINVRLVKQNTYIEEDGTQKKQGDDVLACDNYETDTIEMFGPVLFFIICKGH